MIKDLKINPPDTRGLEVQTNRSQPSRPAQRHRRAQPPEPNTAQEIFDLQKLARLVLDGSIYRFSQYKTQGKNDYSTDTTQQAPPPVDTRNGKYFYDIDNFINYFSSRARSVYEQISRLARERKPHPNQKNRTAQDSDVQSARLYMDMMHNVSNEWNDVKGAVKDILIKSNKAKTPIVTDDILLQATGGRGGGSYGIRGGSRGEIDTGNTIPGDDESVDEGMKTKGPIQEQMRLSRLLTSSSRLYSESKYQLENLTKGGKLPTIFQRDWHTGSWIDMAQRYVVGDSDEEKQRNFIQWASALRTVLNDIFTSWENEYGNRINQDVFDRISARQGNILNTWNNYIRARISEAEQSVPRQQPRQQSRQQPRQMDNFQQSPPRERQLMERLPNGTEIPASGPVNESDIINPRERYYNSGQSRGRR